jgi:hypothetical protein
MSERLDALARRRAELQRRCAMDRQRVLQGIHDLEQPLLGVDRGIQSVQRFAKRPLTIATGIALMIGVGPRRLTKLMSRGVVISAAVKRILSLVRTFT